ncbi:MAG: hypothetical protein PHH70_03815 [Candidatus Gracilibacteria bacterium]|nr:hypothetical protein [Candidatus Gracilibacteria bacterium]
MNEPSRNICQKIEKGVMDIRDPKLRELFIEYARDEQLAVNLGVMPPWRMHQFDSVSRVLGETKHIIEQIMFDYQPHLIPGSEERRTYILEKLGLPRETQASPARPTKYTTDFVS